MPDSTVILRSLKEIEIDGLVVGSAIDSIANWPHHAEAIQALVDAGIPSSVTISVPAPPSPSLDVVRAAKKGEFTKEAVRRIALLVPDWDSIGAIKVVAGMWSTHLANQANTAQTAAKNIYLYARDTVPAKLATIADWAEVDGIDPTAADPFGDGTPWPT